MSPVYTQYEGANLGNLGNQINRKLEIFGRKLEERYCIFYCHFDIYPSSNFDCFTFSIMNCKPTIGRQFVSSQLIFGYMRFMKILCRLYSDLFDISIPLQLIYYSTGYVRQCRVHIIH